jgi:hypothetical protein
LLRITKVYFMIFVMLGEALISCRFFRTIKRYLFVILPLSFRLNIATVFRLVRKIAKSDYFNNFNNAIICGRY